MWNPLYFWFISAGFTAIGSTMLLVWPAGSAELTLGTETTVVVPLTVATSPATTSPTLPSTPQTKPTTRPSTPVTMPTIVKPERKPSGSVTVYVADTQALRGKDEKWKEIFKGITSDPTFSREFGVPLLRWIDMTGVRDWNGAGDLPSVRTSFGNDDWNAILQALGHASAKPDCAPRAIWLIENSSHPKNLAERNKLLPIEKLLPRSLDKTRLTLIWYGHGSESDELQSRFPSSSAVPNRRLISQKEATSIESIANTLKVELDLPLK